MACVCATGALCPTHDGPPLASDVEANAEYRATRHLFSPPARTGPSTAGAPTGAGRGPTAAKTTAPAATGAAVRTTAG